MVKNELDICVVFDTLQKNTANKLMSSWENWGNCSFAGGYDLVRSSSAIYAPMITCASWKSKAELTVHAVSLRWGSVFLEQTQILSGIHFTRHFIQVFVVETKQFVGSNANVILTRQTCGQRSSRAAGSKRRALENYLYDRICHMFPISKCRGDWDLSLCNFWVLAKREPLRSGDFRRKRFSPDKKIGIWHCAAMVFLKVPKKCTDIDLSLFYIVKLESYGKFAGTSDFLALGVCFP